MVDGSAAGVYDGLTLGAEATFAAEGVDGQLRYDPMSMRPFLSYPEGRYAQHWLDVLGRVTEPPTFAHVNWFQREPETGRYLWPGFRENLRVLLWLLAYREGSVSGTQTPVGVVPTAGEPDLTGLDIPDADLATLLSIDPERWEAEMRSRTAHLDAFSGLPDEVWQGPTVTWRRPSPPPHADRGSRADRLFTRNTTHTVSLSALENSTACDVSEVNAGVGT